ncbi:helix-turn-helix domain-containing protein [Microvirga pudoricolor]|uniref:helix-turn-helix domain-containing protein n=1 Tax=Microvirga pudoricolor TaxID=2778729 RepID=UPI0019501527|nr:helix-turn-helix domain-containing protein [Microvirga pudoricolor]MBM6595559.1 helix-turn-helix domain-containing protein [Microvirga pudoricolor]
MTTQNNTSGVHRLLKPQEVADFLGITLRHVYTMIKEGQIAYSRVGRLYRIHPSEVQRVTQQMINVPAGDE